MRKFEDEFSKFSPALYPDAEEDFETEEFSSEHDIEVESKDTKYGHRGRFVEERDRPITKDDSLKKRPQY